MMENTDVEFNPWLLLFLALSLCIYISYHLVKVDDGSLESESALVSSYWTVFHGHCCALQLSGPCWFFL